MPWEHWVPRATQPYRPLEEPLEASRSWHAIRRLFPEAASVVLMPDHIHILLPPTDEAIVRAKLWGFMSGPSRRLLHRDLWQPLDQPRYVNNRDHLRRTIRYIAMNPYRAKLVDDPLDWPWSTYRDVMGVSMDAWPGAVNAFTLFEEKTEFGRANFHEYVSRDRRTPDGTPSLAPPFQPSHLALHNIVEVASAVAAAFRLAPSEIRKHGPARHSYVALAHRVHCASRGPPPLRPTPSYDPKMAQFSRRPPTLSLR